VLGRRLYGPVDSGLGSGSGLGILVAVGRISGCCQLNQRGLRGLD
jgi:hypothetical protein